MFFVRAMSSASGRQGSLARTSSVSVSACGGGRM
jgi:hypothetical protein